MKETIIKNNDDLWNIRTVPPQKQNLKYNKYDAKSIQKDWKKPPLRSLSPK